MADQLGTGTQYLYPDSWSNATNKTANYIGGFPEWGNDVYQNWYGGNLSAQPNTQLTGALTAMSQANPWTPNINTAIGQTQQNSQYDPNKVGQFLSPYVGGVIDANNRLSMQNLTENIMPQVNSTFTGAGQFGSTRNADFLGRAIRDNQQTLNNTNAGVLKSAYDAAQGLYGDWSNRGLSSAAQIGQLAGQGSTLTQQQLTNQLTAGKTQYDLDQGALDKQYQDWLTQQQFPLSALNAVGTAIGNSSKGVQPNTFTPTAQPDDVTRVLTAIQAVSSGLNDTAVQGVLSKLGLSGMF